MVNSTCLKIQHVSMTKWLYRSNLDKYIKLLKRCPKINGYSTEERDYFETLP